MAFTPVVTNAIDSIVRSLTGNKGWLQTISNDGGGLDDTEIQVGDNQVNIIDAMVAVTVANKTSTAVIADKGASHTASLTTVIKALPVKFFKHELNRMQRLGILDSEVEKLIKLGMDGIFAEASKTIIDALSDATLGLTATLGDGQTNFIAESEAEALQNLQQLGSVWGDVSGENDGDPPDWIVAIPEAYGRLLSYSNNVKSQGLGLSPDGKTATWNGTKIWAQKNGTAAKWGAASKPCLFMGNNRWITFRINAVDQPTNGEIVYQNSTHLWTLPIDVTYTYSVDVTTTTGLALKVGRVINGLS